MDDPKAAAARHPFPPPLSTFPRDRVLEPATRRLHWSEVVCPTCGAKGSDECATLSGRDHPRRRALYGSHVPVDTPETGE